MLGAVLVNGVGLSVTSLNCLGRKKKNSQLYFFFRVKLLIVLYNDTLGEK